MNSSSNSAKKLKQLRLPFSRLSNENKIETQKRKQRSDDDETTESVSVPRVDIHQHVDVRSNNSQESKTLISSEFDGEDSGKRRRISETSLRFLLNDLQTQIKVEIAKLSVALIEHEDRLHLAVSQQDFLLAQKLKVSIDGLKEESLQLTSLTNNDKSFQNPRILRGILEKRKKKQRASTHLKISSASPRSEEKKKTIKIKSEEKNKVKEKEGSHEERTQIETKEGEKDRLKDEKREKDRLKREKEERTQREKEEKNEERKRRENEIILKEEKIRKSFASYFLKVSQDNGDSGIKDKEDLLFVLKKDMVLAPLVRGKPFGPFRKKALDEYLDVCSDSNETYLNCLSSSSYVVGQESKTIKGEESEETELTSESSRIITDEPRIRVRKAKLLQFFENKRPPYWGTNSQKSVFISGRKPFGKDEGLLNYDYDSEQDWDFEEDVGESLSETENCKDEDEDEEEEEEEEDDGFFVAHGALDKNEMRNQDYDENLEDLKQKLKAEAWEKEIATKTTDKLKAKVIGCFWLSEASDHVHSLPYQFLVPYAAVSLFGNSTVSLDHLSAHSSSSLSSPESFRNRFFPEESLPELIRLVHENGHNKVFLAKEFTANSQKNMVSSPSLVSRKKVIEKIQEIAEYSKIKRVWLVKDEILNVFGKERSEPWNYVLETPNGRKSTSYSLEENALSEKRTPKKKASLISKSSSSSSPLITKFTRVLNTTDNKNEAFTPKLSTAIPIPKEKKRATLISIKK